MFTSRVVRMLLVTLTVKLASGGAITSAAEPTDFPAAARQRYDEGRDLQQKGQAKEALQAFEEAIKLGMDAFPRVHLQRARSNLDLKQYDRAIAQYTKLIEEFGVEESCRY